LRKREEKCRQLMKSRDGQVKKSDYWSFFKLSHQSHKNLAHISSCLEVKVDEKYGRHIVTNKALAVGDIIAIDEPIFKVIKADDRYSTCYSNNIYQRCANCLMDNLLDLLPCEGCCKTMFCSLKCKDSACENYHKYECDMIDILLKSGIKHIVLRMFFHALSLFKNSIKDMKKFLDKHFDINLTSFSIKKTNNNIDESRRLFLLALSLATKTTHPFDEYIEILKKNQQLFGIFSSDEKFASELLQKFISIGLRDVHGIGSWSLKINGMENIESPVNASQYQQLIGNACYSFSSLLNHSCAPNIKRLNVDDKIVLVVSRPIAANAQLFDSYRQNFNIQSKAERQRSLQDDYGFACDCEACTKDWPLNKDLKVIDEELLEYAWESFENLPYLDDELARKQLKEHCSVFMKHHRHFPSSELIILQECISNCLIAITKPSLQFS
jgi:SET and MYND domain-containing protein 4